MSEFGFKISGKMKLSKNIIGEISLVNIKWLISGYLTNN